LQNDGHRDIHLSGVTVELLIVPAYRPSVLNGVEMIYSGFGHSGSDLQIRIDGMKYVQPFYWPGPGPQPPDYDPYAVPEGIRRLIHQEFRALLREKLTVAINVNDADGDGVTDLNNPVNKALRSVLEYHISGLGRVIRTQIREDAMDVWYLPLLSAPPNLVTPKPKRT
jgi:hypothetical protein